MEKQCNQGVCCDVEECIHNVDGCNCEMSSIKVTKAGTQNAHFCRTYECAENLEEWKNRHVPVFLNY